MDKVFLIGLFLFAICGAYFGLKAADRALKRRVLKWVRLQARLDQVAK